MGGTPGIRGFRQTPCLRQPAARCLSKLNGFDQSDVAVLQSLAHQVAVAIENARLYEQAQQLAALEVRDDGVGFDPAGSFPGHLGLQSMRERVDRLGGVLTVESAPGQGVCVRVRIRRTPEQVTE